MRVTDRRTDGRTDGRTELRLPRPPSDMLARKKRTSQAVDEQRVQLFLAVPAESTEVGARLSITIKQIVEQRQRHLLRRSTVGLNVKQITVIT